MPFFREMWENYDYCLLTFAFRQGTKIKREYPLSKLNFSLCFHFVILKTDDPAQLLKKILG